MPVARAVGAATFAPIRVSSVTCWETAGKVSGVVLAATAIPLAFSAGFGFSMTSDCRLLKEIQLACVSGVESSCAALRGKLAGEDCAADIECGGGNICFRGSCNPKPR